MPFLKLLIAMAALPVAAGCDLSQKKPEVASKHEVVAPGLAAGAGSLGGSSTAPQVLTPGGAGIGVHDEAAEGRKSIRLFGPGVSRRLQTRV